VNSRFQAGVFLVLAVFTGVTTLYLSGGGLGFKVADGAAERLMLASFSDLAGKPQTLSPWRGKVLVVNFWATWCAPCREEIPELMKVKYKYASNGVQFVGIALDNVAKVRDYAKKMHIDYALLIGGIETLGLSRDLGNGAGVLPFTVVLDRAGKVAYVHAGALTEASLTAKLTPLL
jgi:thiol-disulfide isomerase/thioredoxin